MNHHQCNIALRNLGAYSATSLKSLKLKKSVVKQVRKRFWLRRNQQNQKEPMLIKNKTITYVCEAGCIYEGGNAFFASTSYRKAWVAVREKLDELQERGVTFHLVKRNLWNSDYEYVAINKH